MVFEKFPVNSADLSSHIGLDQQVRHTRSSFFFALFLVFLAETAISYGIHFLNLSPHSLSPLVDAALMTIFAIPLFYFFLYRPILRQNRELHDLRNELSQMVEERTAELSSQNTRLMHYHDIWKMINHMLSLSLTCEDQQEFFQEVIREIIAIPWLSIDHKGSLFVFDQEKNVLVMKSQFGMSPEIIERCKTVSPGHCICGKAARSKEIIWKDSIDEDHEVYFEGMAQHGHYCVPILYGTRLMGLLNMYIGHGHRQSSEEIMFLEIIGKNLGNILYSFELSEKQAALTEQYLQTQKMEALGRLSCGISHDFNNLLAAMKGYTELSMQLTPQEGKIHSYLTQVNLAVDRAHALTKQLLVFSRKQQVEREVVDLNTVIDILLKMIIRLVGERIKVTDLRKKSTLPVLGCRGNLEQVLLNLFINSRDAIGPGIGEISIDSGITTFDHPMRFPVGELVPQDYCWFEIRDNGTGMDAMTMKHLFEPFYSTKELGKGTGLGLSVVSEIIKDHQGGISVTSEPGCGAEFRVYLPVSKASGTPEEGPVGPVVHKMPLGLDILLIEDHLELQDMMSSFLNDSGARINAFSNLKSARQFLDGERIPDLIISDIGLSDGDGFEFCHEISRDYPRLRCILISGYSERMGLLNELPTNFMLLNKPFSLTRLLEIIQQLFEGD